MSKSILDNYTLNWIQRHKAKGTVIKVPMTKARRRFLRQIFDGFDSDGGGEIDFNEFLAASRFANPKVSRDEVVKIFNELDIDGGGGISFEEFCSGMAKKDAELTM